MLIIYSSYNSYRSWTVGDKNPIPEADLRQVTDIRADEKELTYLWNRFPFIRDGKYPQVAGHDPASFERVAKSVRWYGDDAKFIVGNLV